MPRARCRPGAPASRPGPACRPYLPTGQFCSSHQQHGCLAAVFNRRLDRLYIESGVTGNERFADERGSRSRLGAQVNTALFCLDGKTALVTGGAHGLGRMIAEGLLQAGATVAITSRDAERCAAAAAEMESMGRCIALPADLSTPDAAVTLAQNYRETLGVCHVLVNNAGKTWGAPIENFPDKAWAGVMAVNVQAPFTLIRELLPELSAAGTADDPARVINIGSVAGMKAERLQAYSYAASKAAIHMLTRDLAGDLASRHITVNAVIPGYFPTHMTAHMHDGDQVDAGLLSHIPLGRLGRPEDIAGIVVLLSARSGRYITGALIPVDGGLAGCS